MLDLIFLNRKDSAEFLGIDVEKFDRDVKPRIKAIKLAGKIFFKLDELKNYSGSRPFNSKTLLTGEKPTADKEGVVIRPCDPDTAKLKKTYKKLPKGTQAKLDALLGQLQKIADKAHGRMKG